MIHSAILSSTAINKIEFDDEKGEITVTFVKGGTTTERCDMQTYERFKVASSAGRFFNENFKK